MMKPLKFLALFILYIHVSLGTNDDVNECNGYYCAYGSNMYDRIKAFYDTHTLNDDNKVSPEKINRLAENYGHHSETLFDELRRKYVRPLLVHQYNSVPLAPPFPRISLKQLESGDHRFDAYKRGARPFVLVDAANEWNALTRWRDPKYLANLFPDAVVDFYPYNMLEGGEKPFLWRLKPALLNQLTHVGSFSDDKGKEFYPGRYLHLQLTPKMFRKLRSRNDISPYPKWFNQDRWWMRRCLSDATAEEYHIKTHWQIILTGTRGAGMFNHSDSLLTSSWHTHITGKKWWIVCGTNEKSGPNEGKFECFEDVMKPGDTLYYPRYFYHQTQNLETTTTTLTGTVVNSHNWDTIARRLFSECGHDALKFDFSGELCDDLQKCYEVWRRRFTGRDHAKPLYPSWRDVASKESIATKDARKTSDSNYDGRNFIGTK